MASIFKVARRRSHGSFGRREGVSRLNTINSSHYGFYVTDTFGLVWPICSVRR
jgi:hypothetical protein